MWIWQLIGCRIHMIMARARAAAAVAAAAALAAVAAVAALDVSSGDDGRALGG
jgi:hypothetical protein